MKLISVECQKCGARLNLSADQEMITCRVCSSTLMLRPETANRPKQSFTPEQIAEFQLELERLDYQWQQFCDRNRYASMYTEGGKVSQGDNAILGIIGPLIGIVWIVLLDYLGISNYFLIGMGVAFIIFSIHASATFSEQKHRNRDRFEEYSQRRMHLVSLISSADEMPPSEQTAPNPDRKSNPFEEDGPSTGKLSWSI